MNFSREELTTLQSALQCLLTHMNDRYEARILHLQNLSVRIQEEISSNPPLETRMGGACAHRLIERSSGNCDRCKVKLDHLIPVKIQRKVGEAIRITNTADHSPRIRVVLFLQAGSLHDGDKTLEINDEQMGQVPTILSLEAMRDIVAWAESNT
jgi:hypothetical protein